MAQGSVGAVTAGCTHIPLNSWLCFRFRELMCVIIKAKNINLLNQRFVVIWSKIIIKIKCSVIACKRKVNFKFPSNELMIKILSSELKCAMHEQSCN